LPGELAGLGVGFQLGDGFKEGQAFFGGQAVEDKAGVVEAGECDGGEGNMAEEGGKAFGIGESASGFDEAANEDAQEDNFMFEAGEIEFVEVGDVGRVELAGVETVLEGVTVPLLTAAMTLDLRLTPPKTAGQADGRGRGFRDRGAPIWGRNNRKYVLVRL
jgi:hypothetical protein